MPSRRARGRRLRRAVILLLLILVVGIPGFFWLSFTPHGFPDSVLHTDARVRVEDGPQALRFEPVSPAVPGARMLFYPGCPVRAEAYAPFARAIAEAGYAVYLARIPQLCATQPGQQQELFAATQAILTGGSAPLVLAGHSRGGALASQFAADHPSALAGLLLEGTVHPRDVNLSALKIPVVKVLASEDGVAPEAKSRASLALLPPSTRWVRIEGGNHAQFGYYRFQLADGRPRISRAEQQRQVIAATLELLRYCSRTGS